MLMLLSERLDRLVGVVVKYNTSSVKRNTKIHMSAITSLLNRIISWMLANRIKFGSWPESALRHALQLP